MAKIKNIDKANCWWGCAYWNGNIHIVGGHKKWHKFWKHLIISYKIKHILTLWSNNSYLTVYLRETKHFYKNNFLHNNPKLEMVQLSIEVECINHLRYIHTREYYAAIKRGCWYIWHHHISWLKSVTKDYIL